MVTPTVNRGFGELFGEAKGELDSLQKSMASILPSMPGMPVGKYFDLAIGIDFEPTIAPPCPIFPVPHVGMVFDIVGAIMNAIAAVLPPPPPDDGSGGTSVLGVANAVVGAMKPSVKVHNQWVNNAGTGILHLPGIVIHLLPLAKPMASSEMWMGSSTVLADGGPCSTQFHPALSCNLVGFPSLFRINKPPKPKMALMLPTSMLLAILSGGPPVLVGGPPTIDLFQLMFKMGLKGMGKAWKKLGDKMQDMVKHVAPKNPKLAGILQSVKCKSFGEPVDAATGRVISANIDFELPGPIPLVWERTYYSDAEINGPIGYNKHHSYNMGLYDMGNGFFTLRLADGRETVLPQLYTGEIFYSRQEKLQWQKDENGYLLTTDNKLGHRFNGNKNREGYQMLSSIEDVQGFDIQFSYDRKGCLQRIKDSAERILEVINDEEGRIVCIQINANHKTINLVQYVYDAAGNMCQTADALGARKYFYYEGHLMVKLTNQSGTSFYWEYEGKADAAKCIHTWGDDGVLEYWTQYADGHTSTRNSLGHTTEYFYDHRKLIHKIVDANGGITRQVYNHFEEPELIVDPEGYSTRYQYNSFGKVTRVTNQNDEVTSYSYDEQLNLVGLSSPANKNIGWNYDEQGRMISRTGTDNRTVSFEYEGRHLKRIINPKKQAVELQYDQRHNLSAMFFPDGLRQDWTFDELGNLLQSVDIRGNTTQYAYDAVANITWMKEPDGNQHRFAYDAAHNLVQAEDETHRLQFTYGPLGILTSRSQNGRRVGFAYDTELQLKSITNEGGEVYRFGLDALGQVVSEWGFDGLNRRYQRDGNGRVRKVLRPAEKWTSYDYDGLGNIVKEEHSDGTLSAYRYSKDSELLQAFNEDIQITLQRDKAGRITKELQGSYEVTHSYNREGNLVNTASSLSAHLEFDYDDTGNLLAMKANGWQAGFARDNTGLELQRSLSGGVEVRTERDQLGRVTRRSIGTQRTEQSRVKYEWDRGNKLRKTLDELTRAKTDFEYDAFDNLVSATYRGEGPAATIYRVPDAIGNLFKTAERTDRKYSKGGRLQKDDTYNYYYDAEGNIVFKEFQRNQNLLAKDKTDYAREKGIQLTATATGWGYEWADNGMLKKVINPGGAAIEFHYDPLGRRIAKKSRGRVTRWVWNGNTPLHEWHYAGDFPPQAAVTAGGEMLETKEPVENLTTWVFEENSFVPAAKLVGEEKYSIVTDYLGTPTHAFDGAGEKVWERQLDIYGAVRKYVGTKGLVPYLYQGQYVDDETGLAYNRFRYYDPESGNYLSQDPIGLRGGLKIYGYVHDTNAWLDWFGLSRIPRTNGHWDGTPGNSNWFSDNPKVTSITKGEGIPYNNGHADFSKWSEGDMEIKNMTGTKKDFDLVHEQLKIEGGLNSRAEAERFLKENGLTAHHHQDMKTIQLIPSDLHNNVPHEGGASKLRKTQH